MGYSVCVTGFQISTIVMCTITGIFGLVAYMEDAQWNRNRSPLKDQNDSEFLTRATYYFSYVICERAESAEVALACPPGFSELTKLRVAYKRDLVHPRKYNDNLRKAVLNRKEEYLLLEHRETIFQLIPMAIVSAMILFSTVHLYLCCVLSSFVYRHVLNIWFHWIGGTLILVALVIYWHSSNSIRTNNELLALKAQTQAMEFYNSVERKQYFFNNTLRGAHACTSFMSSKIQGCTEMKSYVDYSGMCPNEALKLVCLVPFGVTFLLYYLTCCAISCCSQSGSPGPSTNSQCQTHAVCTAPMARTSIQLPSLCLPPSSIDMNANGHFLEPPPAYETIGPRRLPSFSFY